MAVGKHILVAPLDWGLGHTTRCIPLIRHLLCGGHRVTISGDAVQRSFIRSVFPDVHTIPLDGYNIRYDRGRFGTVLRIMRQAPRIAACISREHHWLDSAISRHSFDGVISDNRYGLWSSRIPSVILTHQLQPRTGMGAPANTLLRRILYRYLMRFSEIWVVDKEKNAESLAGDLSHPTQIPLKASYIGHLSALRVPVSPPGNAGLLVLLSGPEPQRTLLSDLIWEQLPAMNRPVVFVEGKAGVHRISASALITHLDRIPPIEVSGLMHAASLVICRSGYSTLMDLDRLQKRALLIPTPGQGEQEYLAKRCAERGAHRRAAQNGLDLPAALHGIEDRQTKDNAACFGLFQPVLDRWVASL